MLSNRKTRFAVIGLLLFSGLFVVYRYAPIHFVGANEDVDSLVEQLASANQPPAVDEPLFNLGEFFNNPGGWDLKAQKRVSDAYYKLRAMGKEAFPYLINHFDDDRYSHHRSWSTFYPVSVGEACKLLIHEQVDIRGIMYKARESPNGNVIGYEFDEYVRSHFGSYAAWWRANRNRSLREMRVATVEWRIEKEKAYGFISDEQTDSILSELERVRQKAERKPEVLELPPPDWYTVDELVFRYQHIQLVRQQSSVD